MSEAASPQNCVHLHTQTATTTSMRTKTRVAEPLIEPMLLVRSVHCVPRDRLPPPKRIDYRTKKLARLTNDIQQLTEQIAQLRDLRQLLYQRTMSRAESAAGSVAKTVRTYFDVFSHGYRPHVQPPEGGRLLTDGFLVSVMDEDFIGGGFRGVPTLIEQWKRFSTLFGGLQLRLLDLHVVPLDTEDEEDMRARATARAAHSGHVTLKTIEILFPHVLSNAALVMSLLGQQVSGDGTTDFIFDCATGRIIECRIDIDMVGTFARVVRNPHDLAVLFKMALLTAECFVGEKDSCIVEGKAVAASRSVQQDDRMSVRSILSPEDEDMVN